MDAFARLKPSPASNEFRKDLVKLYAHILGFLAQAICIQRKGSTAWFAQAFWDMSDLTGFEEKCDILCARASEGARICDSRDALDTQLRSLDAIHNVHANVTKLHEKVDLSKLETAKEATYNSSSEGELPQCLPDTRTDLLQQIFDWTADQAGKHIFWLCGKAGTGKSTISRTVAQKLDDEGLLGASFFFRRGRADRSHSKLLFPTIARQLVDVFPNIAHAVAAALDQDSLLCGRYLNVQFEHLLKEPLQSVDPCGLPSAGIVLVIDALDECDSGDSIKRILLLLSRVRAITPVRLRIFVTSRPELPVELGFMDMSGDLHHDIRLEEAQQMSIAHDIRVFYEHEFSKIKKNSWRQHDELSVEWPGERSIRSLVEQAIPLFIFAFTVSRYIAEVDPRERLDLILQQNSNKSLHGLKRTYLPILNQTVATVDDSQRTNRVVAFQRIVGSIILLSDPLSAYALCSLLEISPRDIVKALGPLHSVLNIPRAPDGRMDLETPITLFHLSFRDFLIDEDLRDENIFWISGNETHSTLALRCISLLESGVLKENMCDVPILGTRRSEVAQSKVHASLTEAVAYACRYWVEHVVESGEHIQDDCAVHEFLKKHLLHWMEALSWLGMTSDVIQALKTLHANVDVSHVP